MGSQFQMLGLYLAGFLCLMLAVLKLTIEGHWSWWRVLLPLWVILGHNALYIAVGFVWLSFADDGPTGDEATIRESAGSYAYQVAALLCFLTFADNMLGRIEETGETTWLGLRSGWWALIVASGVLSVVCQLLFWSTVVPAGNRPTWGEKRAPASPEFTLTSNTVLRMRASIAFLTIRGNRQSLRYVLLFSLSSPVIPESGPF